MIFQTRVLHARIENRLCQTLQYGDWLIFTIFIFLDESISLLKEKEDKWHDLATSIAKIR